METRIKIKYEIKEKGEIRIFGTKFVENNKEKLKMEINREIIELNEYYYSQSVNENIEIILIETEKLTDMSYIFEGCSSLSSLPDISNWNTSNVTNMSFMFSRCSSLSSLPNISKWDTSNVTNMSSMFSCCNALSCLPDISKWNTSKVTNMSYMFDRCNTLSTLPDISK